MNINGLLGYTISLFIVSIGLIMIGPKGGLHPDVAARYKAMTGDFRGTATAPCSQGNGEGLPDFLRGVSPSSSCFIGLDFDFQGRTAFGLGSDNKLDASPMTNVWFSVDAFLSKDAPVELGITHRWAGDATIHQFARVGATHSDYIQRSVKYGNFESSLTAEQQRTALLITSLVSALTAPELAQNEAMRWTKDSSASHLDITVGNELLSWRCTPSPEAHLRCETSQATLAIVKHPGVRWKLIIDMSNWEQINHHYLPKDWVISWGDKNWVEYRGKLIAVRRTLPEEKNQEKTRHEFPLAS